MHNVVVEDVTFRLRPFRQRAGLTQEQLAAKLGVDQANISQWERGRMPHASRLPQLAEVFNCSIDDFFK